MSDENKFDGYGNGNNEGNGNDSFFENHTTQNYYSGSYTSPELEPKKKRGRGIGIVAALVAGIVLLVSLGVGVSQISFPKQKDDVNVESSTGKEESIDSDLDHAQEETKEPHYTLSKADSIDTTDMVQAIVLDVSPIIEEVMPSVVAIVSTIEFSNGYKTSQSEGSGTGVILAQDDSEILIVTNAHVIEEESSYYYYNVDVVAINITFNDGSVAEAYVKGTDKESDLAVIAVKLEDISEETLGKIKVATIGDSNKLKIGNGVIAIGNALGYGQSATIGYISALNRSVPFSDGYTRNLIQTDAAINPGNSGGGLFDMYGRLIGINESKTVSEDVEGIGFAIPISEAEEIITELMNTVPRVPYSDEERGYMGISTMDVPNSYVIAGYPEGAVIMAVAEGSPAEEAGLMLQDIVIGVNDVDIDSSTELIEELAYYGIGDTVVLRVKRIQHNRFVETEITVTLGDKTVIENLQETTTESNQE